MERQEQEAQAQDWVDLEANNAQPAPPAPLTPVDPVQPTFGGPIMVKPADYELVSPPAPADLSNSEEEHEHYLKRYQVYHERKGKYVPFDPADAVPVLDLDEQNEKYYFYVNVRYTVNQRRYPNKEFSQSSNAEPWTALSNFSEPLLSFCKVFIGNVFYDGSTTECADTTFFPQLPEMQDILSLSQALISKMKNDEATPEERLSCAKKLGIVGSGTLSITSDSAKVATISVPGEVVPNVDLPTSITDSVINAALQTSVEHLEVLVRGLEDLFKPTADRLRMLLANGHIEYDLLPYFFKPGQLLTYKDSLFKNELSAFVVKDRAEQTVYRNNGVPAQTFSVNGHTKRWTGTVYADVPFSQTIRPFSGTKAIADLPIEHITKERETLLRERGKLYMKYSGPPQHRLFNNDRVIIDEFSYSENGGSYMRTEMYDDDGFPGDTPPVQNENDETLELLLPPEVHGFNLTSKQWSSFNLYGLKPVVFDEKAWDHLVLDQDVKTLIKGLVDVTTSENLHGEEVITDVITGKGGGLIALLHGPPGTGKTLTAEAVAEHLNRPLYMVGSSELSTEASELELNLRRILALATKWDAVMLIDEADIFLEQRSLHEIRRNSLVSVALRVFEYHQGVLFLTTNRIQTFDSAFLSRFSIAIKYPELSSASRLAVWSKFLAMAGCTIVSTMNAASLAEHRAPILEEKVREMADAHVLNGRTIKNVVKTAQALALSSSKPMSLEHIQVVLRVQAKFLEDFKGQVEID